MSVLRSAGILRSSSTPERFIPGTACGLGRGRRRATGVYSRNSNVYRNENIFRPYSAYSIPVPNVDPGPDGVVRRQ